MILSTILASTFASNSVSATTLELKPTTYPMKDNLQVPLNPHTLKEDLTLLPYNEKNQIETDYIYNEDNFYSKKFTLLNYEEWKYDKLKLTFTRDDQYLYPLYDVKTIYSYWQQDSWTDIVTFSFDVPYSKDVTFSTPLVSELYEGRYILDVTAINKEDVDKLTTEEDPHFISLYSNTAENRYNFFKNMYIKDLHDQNNHNAGLYKKVEHVLDVATEKYPSKAIDIITGVEQKIDLRISENEKALRIYSNNITNDSEFKQVEKKLREKIYESRVLDMIKSYVKEYKASKTYTPYERELFSDLFSL